MSHPRLAASAVATFLSLAAVTAQRQPAAVPFRVLPAPPSLCQQFDVVAGTVQDLQLPPGNPTALSVEVSLGGTRVRIQLTQHEVRTPNFQLWERGANGTVLLPTPGCVTYRGEVAGDGGSEVAATLVGGSLTAFVREGDEDLWVVQPVRDVQPTAGAAVHFVFRSLDNVNLPVNCGVVTGPIGNLPGFALEADFPFFQLNGSNVTATQNDVTGIVNAMDVIYRRDTQISLQVSQLFVDSVPDPYTTNSPGTLLNQFGNFWNANRGAVARDLAHLFTGRNIGAASGGTIGVAFLSTVCNLGAAYGISQSRFSANYSWRVGVTAHEIGHNFGAGHCDGASPCNIMCSGVGGCGNNQASFGATEQAQIIAYRQSVGCLTQQLTVPQITGTNPVQIETWRAPLVTLTGSGFVGTNLVTVAGQPITTGIQVVSDTQLRFTPPSGLPLGVHTFTVTNSAGSSNVAAFIYQAVNPCEMYVPGNVLGGTNLTWQMGGLANDFGYLLVSLASTTSPFQGFPLLDGASVLWAGGLDTRGMASFTIPVPANVLHLVRVYSQLLAIQNGTLLARSTSGVLSTLVVF
jgi:hypothetical protein